MSGRSDAQIKPVVLEAKAVEKYGTGQALLVSTQEIAMEGAGRLGMRYKKSRPAYENS